MEKIEMRANSNASLLEKGIKVLLKELGTVQTIEFFQILGLNKGNSVREIESKTGKMSKEEVFKALKKIRSAKRKSSMRLINKVIKEVRERMQENKKSRRKV